MITVPGLHGQVTTIDLRDESTARGRVINVDAFMNIRLEKVLYRDRRGRVSSMDDLFITDHMNIIETIETQLAKIHHVRNFGASGGCKEYSKKK
uniref:Sm domain-containing protein n=1 Tax=Sinocyclocheilus grahami TaxID=75366 RepID=A0A672RIL0_SINGR